MRTLYDILLSARTGEACTDAELRCALAAMDALETLSGMAIRRLSRTEHVGRHERLKRALDSDPQVWLGPERDPTQADAQSRARAAAELVGAWFGREER